MTWRIDQGDCRELLRGMAAESVHLICTSPPYWGLRDYGLPPLVWGGDEGCEHSWDVEQRTGQIRTGLGLAALGERYRGGGHKQGKVPDIDVETATCVKCGCWRGSLGLEPTPELYIEHMVEVFREVWRVLRKDGTLFVNMGDTYASGARGPNEGHSDKIGSRVGKEGYAHQSNRNMRGHPVLKPKDLCGMPWRLAFALQADGWWLRSEIIWAKPNPMPESVRDRPTKAHETVFLLTKAARYYYDGDAIREPHKEPWRSTGKVEKMGSGRYIEYGVNDGFGLQGNKPRLYNPAGRNKRTVWTIPTSPFAGAHFATFPPKLIEPMILTSPTKCCAVCGKGWERVTDTSYTKGGGGGPSGKIGTASGMTQPMPERKTKHVTTLGFRPGCDCLFPPWVPTPRQDKEETDAAYAMRIIPVLEEQCQLVAIYESAEPEDTVPATVLDCFLGSGTSIMVALRHGRNAIGLELSETYAEMARKRIVEDNPMFNGGVT